MARLEEIAKWLRQQAIRSDAMNITNRSETGYLALFTGGKAKDKVLAAALLGKAASIPVCRIDLTAVVSKYIGETEKNLAQLFDEVASDRRILFFDEADALFGKRTLVQDAQDQYANQEVSYLLERMEQYPGLSILSTNVRWNLEKTLLRRFQGVVHFP
jgi:SpoVK/Ycf46/Vps4 family AAA+-type ATPase